MQQILLVIFGRQEKLLLDNHVTRNSIEVASVDLHARTVFKKDHGSSGGERRWEREGPMEGDGRGGRKAASSAKCGNVVRLCDSDHEAS